MALSDEEKIKAYCTLSEQLHTQYSQRRDLEWKIHISIWTLISATGYLLITQKIPVGNNLAWLILIIPLHFIWCVKIHAGGFRAQYLSRYYRRAAEQLLNPIGPLIDDKVGDENPDK